MTKLSSYQKLKAKVQELEKEKRILVFTPKSKEAYAIKGRVEMINSQAEGIMYGSRCLQGKMGIQIKNPETLFISKDLGIIAGTP